MNLNRKLFLVAVLAIAFFYSSAASAKPAASKVKDSEWDPYGNTCKQEGKCTFSRKEILPGNIPAEVQIVSLGAFRADVDKIFDYAFDDVRRVAALLDEDDPASEVAYVNANAGKGFVEVGPEFIQIITAAKKAFLWTDGAFDITATPEVGNFRHVKIAGKMVLLKKRGMRINFKNIIHGYIADLLIRAIYNANIDDALADAVFATRSIGSSVAGHWRTQVDDSEGRFAKRGMTLDTSNVSVGSVVAGKNAPVIDPRWAIPVETQCRSVTIISRNAAVSQALAYGIYVLGPEKGMALITTLQNIRGVIVNNSGSFLKSPGI